MFQPHLHPAIAFYRNQLRLLWLCEFLRHLNDGRRNGPLNFFVEDDIKQLNQANPLLASFADQEVVLKLLEQLTVLVRRKQDVLQQSRLGAALVKLPHAGEDVSPVARQVLVHAHVVKS